MDVKQLIRDARAPEDKIPLCLRADLVAEYEQVTRKLKKARAESSASLAGPGERVAALEERLADLREQMKASTLTVHLRALAPPKYQALVEKYPPRVNDDKVDLRDLKFGFNVATFFPELVKACTVSPELDEEDWEDLLGDEGKLTDAQVEKLYTTAWELNRKDIDLPF